MHGSTGGSWKRSAWSRPPKWDNPMGNHGHQGFGTYRQTIATAPAPDPTHPRVVADHLDDEAQSVTSGSPHVCLESFTAGGETGGSPLLATSDQWGHTSFPPTAMSRLAVSRQARPAGRIITVHRELPVHRPGPSRRRPRRLSLTCPGPGTGRSGIGPRSTNAAPTSPNWPR